LKKAQGAMPANGSTTATSRPPVEVVLEWIAAIAAVLSLIAGSFQVTRLFSGVRERKRLIAESLDVAQRQQSGGGSLLVDHPRDRAQKRRRRRTVCEAVRPVE
jgi:hypothetical protein